MSDQKTIKKGQRIVIVFVAIILVSIAALVYSVSIKPGMNLKAANNQVVNTLGSDNTRVQQRCPGSEELNPVCIRAYYNAGSAPDIQRSVKQGLERAGFTVRSLEGGLDGPNQTVYLVYDSSRDVSTSVVIMDTSNTAYKKSQGNIQTKSTAGIGTYNRGK